MRSFIFSFLAHLTLLALFMGATAVESQHVQFVQVQMLEKSNPAPAPVAAKIDKAAKPIKKTVPTPELNSTPDAASESVINLHQDGIRSDEVFSYLVTLIYKNRIYPYDSIRLKQQGLVTVSFYINESGQITDIAVLQACGHRQLNQAAVKTLESLKLNKEFPKIESLFNRQYSFTFDFEIIKT